MPMIEEDGVYYHPDFIGNRTELKDGSSTLLDMLANVVDRNRDSDFLGHIVEDKVVYESYDVIYEKIKAVGAFIRKLKGRLDACNKDDEKENKDEDEDISKRHDIPLTFDLLELIGIYSVNRPEWIVSEYSTYASYSSNCPLYSTFGAEAIQYILDQTRMRICFVSGVKAESLYNDILQHNKYNIKALISYDKLSDTLERSINDIGVEVYYINDIIEEYKINDVEGDKESMSRNSVKKSSLSNNADKTKNDNNKCMNEEGCDEKGVGVFKPFININTIYTDLPVSSSIATICYTSGTSGHPKGVILTHLNFIVTLIGFLEAKACNGAFSIFKSDTYISYLPLAHVMERVCVFCVTGAGARVGFFRGNAKILQQDLKIIAPTFLTGVPRVFNVFYQKISEEVQKRNVVLRGIFYLSMKYKKLMQKFGIYKSSLLDKLIFKRIKKEFGGNLRAAMNGSAPLTGPVTEYLQGIFSLRIFQGYGQTEGTAATLLMTTENIDNENVGIPFPSNIIKLMPTDEHPGGKKGEIYVKGLNVAQGYFLRPDLNKETFYDGWLATGDIAEVLRSSYDKNSYYFRIIGRRKEIFKTSLGEYIVPEKIENILKGGIIEDILIAGKSCQDYIVAIVVSKDHNLSTEEIMHKVAEAGEHAYKKGRLTRFEIPRKIHVLREDFESFGDCITPTMKKKRAVMENIFKNEIVELYK